MLFLFIFLNCFMYLVAENQILMSIPGEVSAENYSYYSLSYDGSISLHLHTITGDADLYVSQVYTTPTYEPDMYCLQSSTCGEDIVQIPESLRRPLGIGVYGHPSHEKSTFILDVVFHYNKENGNNEEQIEVHFQSPKQIPAETMLHDSKEEESIIGALLWSFIDIFLEVLFL